MLPIHILPLPEETLDLAFPRRYHLLSVLIFLCPLPCLVKFNPRLVPGAAYIGDPFAAIVVVAAERTDPRVLALNSAGDDLGADGAKEVLDLLGGIVAYVVDQLGAVGWWRAGYGAGISLVPDIALVLAGPVVLSWCLEIDAELSAHRS